MVVDIGFLQPDKVVVAVQRLGRIDAEDLAFADVDVAEVHPDRDVVLDLGRLEGGAALDQRGAGQEGLRQDQAARTAKGIERAGVLADRGRHRQRQAARFDHRIGNETALEEPVVLVDRQPWHFGAVDRAVTLPDILVIGIARRMADLAQRPEHPVDAFAALGGTQTGQDPPAIRQRQRIGGERLRWRRAHRPGIVLADGGRQRRIETRTAAALEHAGIDIGDGWFVSGDRGRCSGWRRRRGGGGNRCGLRQHPCEDQRRDRHHSP